MAREVPCFYVQYPVMKHRMADLYEVPDLITPKRFHTGQFDIPAKSRHTRSRQCSSGNNTELSRDVARFHVTYPVQQNRKLDFKEIPDSVTVKGSSPFKLIIRINIVLEYTSKLLLGNTLRRLVR